MTRKCHVRFVRELGSEMGSAYLPCEAKRNCVRVTERGEEAWSEVASRWTRTG